MKEFRITVEPNRGFTHPLKIEVKELNRLLPEMKILALNPVQLGNFGRYFLGLDCGEIQNERIINGVLMAMQEIGYSIVEATLIDVVSGVTEGCLLGALGGLGVSFKSKDPKVMLAVSCIGMAVGGWFGRNVCWERTIFGVHWDQTVGWQFIPIHSQTWPSREQFLSPIRSLGN